MRDYFFTLADALSERVAAAETLLLSFNGEASDFTRLNQGRVRQAEMVGNAIEIIAHIAGAAITDVVDLAIHSTGHCRFTHAYQVVDMDAIGPRRLVCADHRQTLLQPIER